MVKSQTSSILSTTSDPANDHTAVLVPLSTPKSVQRKDRAYELKRNLERMSETIRAQHDFHNPAHGTAMLMYMVGALNGILERKDTDPVIQALYLDDRIPQLRGYLDALAKWASFYSNLGPDDVQPTGADRCL